MLKTKGFSLWLMPSGEVYDILNTLISGLSMEYNTPFFQPHITLLDEVLISEKEIVSKTAQLSSIINPFKIELDEIKYLNEYFSCLFISVKQTNELINANLKAKKIFNRKNDVKYVPHLSLIYGNLLPQIKKEIITEIGRKIPLSFDVNKIYLVSTKGAPKDCYCVKEIPLNK
ncbi:MAG: 2'-5' RNA ligase family protein [Nanoarchaeota archaeon]|nr:2'-5' RNA ligase family protein [Nanoarchaeota archaeon]